MCSGISTRLRAAAPSPPRCQTHHRRYHRIRRPPGNSLRPPSPRVRPNPPANQKRHISCPGYFQKATLFACPSFFQEPFGLVNAEATACATPVVGSNCGGIPEVLGDAGVVVNPEQAEDFASALSQLLDDPTRRSQMGAASLARSRESFDWTAISQTWLHALQL